MRLSQTQRIKVVINITHLKKSMLAAFVALSVATANAQTIKGVVTDADNGEPIIGATIKVKETSKAAVTDMNGKYSITGLTTGRYTIEASYIGYQPAVIPEILVTEGKEVVINVPISEGLKELGEVVVKPRISKEGAVNKMALVGARMLSMEEASRYAGGYSDPARLVTAFAGVAGNSKTTTACRCTAMRRRPCSGDLRAWRSSARTTSPTPSTWAQDSSAHSTPMCSTTPTSTSEPSQPSTAMPSQACLT